MICVLVLYSSFNIFAIWCKNANQGPCCSTNTS